MPPNQIVLNGELDQVVTALERLKGLLRPGQLSFKVARLLHFLRPVMEEFQQQQRALLAESVTTREENGKQVMNIWPDLDKDGNEIGVRFELKPGSDFPTRQIQLVQVNIEIHGSLLLTTKDIDLLAKETVTPTSPDQVPDYEALLIVVEDQSRQMAKPESQPRHRRKRS